MQNQFPGGGGADCSPTNGGQPPDVAADVSPTQNVEFLNEGLWVFNKNGSPVSTCSQTATTPCFTLNNFWCGINGANGQPLPGCSGTARPFDTQIAFDPFDQRWIATSESQDAFNLYFAVSNSADASGSWSLWSLGQGSICPGGYQIIDQPIVGYSSSWVAVDIRCFTSSGVGAPNDSLVLIPNSNITGGTFTPQPTIQLTAFPINTRPSRDLSALASPAPPPYPYLVLAGANVPASSSPFLTFASIDSSGNFASGSGILSGNSATVGATGSFTLPFGQQPGCTTFSSGTPGCEISTGDARVQHVIIQYDRRDGTHYAFAAFATGFSSTASQALMFMEQIETGTTSGTQSVGGVLAYPSIAVDDDLDIYQTWTEFLSTVDPFSSYFLTAGPIFEGETQFVGEGDLQTSSAAYTGNLNCPPSTSTQRWGDYTSTAWDPNGISASGESGAFWSVQEFTTGADNQSTEWVELSDPFPFFVGTSVAEGECPNGPGSQCTMTLTAPSNASFGDVLIASIQEGQTFGTSGLTVPAGWTKLPFTNRSGAIKFTSSNACGYGSTGWLVAHVYGSGNDTGKYNFTFTPTCYSTCDSSCTYGEILGRILAYRGAGENFSSYTAWGYPFSGNKSTITLGSVSPPAETELLSIFCSGYGNEGTESESDVAYSAPTGTPLLTPETSLTPYLGMMGADVGAPVGGQTFGSYSTTTTNKNTGATVSSIVMGWQVAIPEP